MISADVLIRDAAATAHSPLSGIAAGFLSDLLGVRGGSSSCPRFEKPCASSMRTIVASYVAVIARVSVAGAFSAAMAGSMNWPLALPFAAGMMVKAITAADSCGGCDETSCKAPSKIHILSSCNVFFGGIESQLD